MIRVDDADFRLYVGDVREQLRLLDDSSVDCVVTSPPYWGLRDYGTGRWEGGDPGCEHSVGGQVADSKAPGAIAGGVRPGVDASRCRLCGAVRVDRQIGLEESPAAYVAELVEVFREVRRVLAPHGTVWLNLGDSYNSNPKGTMNGQDKSGLASTRTQENAPAGVKALAAGLKVKDRVMIPATVALALRDDGWFLRAEVVWRKKNSMPESVRDRPTSAHEMVYLLTKQAFYYYDFEASKEPFATKRLPGQKVNTTEHYGGNGHRVSRGNTGLTAALHEVHDRLRAESVHPGQETLDPSLPPEAPRGADGRRRTKLTTGPGSHENYSSREQAERWPTGGRNMRDVWEAADGREAYALELARLLVDDLAAGDDGSAESVWEIATAQLKEAHFAVFPEELVLKAITAGCPEQVCVHCGTPRVRVDEALGWSDCGCQTPGMRPDDYEVVGTPTGDELGPDTTMETGRRGLGRQRDPDGGTRPITRYEQRKYAVQLRELRAYPESWAEATDGISEEALAHWMRTDRAGARPIPPDILDGWLEMGFLRPVEVPVPVPVTYRPGRVLDPFLGSGQTAIVARKTGRHVVGIELKPEYAEMIVRRTAQQSLLA